MTESTTNKAASSLVWPSLRVDEWTASREILHTWTKIVGKIRLTHAPMINHWWQVTLYVSPRGLTTSAIPYDAGVFDLEFDFLEHRLHIRSSDGGARPHPSGVSPHHLRGGRRTRQVGPSRTGRRFAPVR